MNTTEQEHHMRDYYTSIIHIKCVTKHITVNTDTADQQLILQLNNR